MNEIEKLLKENNKLLKENNSLTEKYFKQSINYLAFIGQINKQNFNQFEAIKKLLNELVNKDSKTKLFGGSDGNTWFNRLRRYSKRKSK